MPDIDRLAGWLIRRARAVASSGAPSPDGLLSRYRGASLDSVVPGRVCRGRIGRCLAIEREADTQIAAPSEEDCARSILGQLQLLFGIGPRRDARLRRDGFDSIPALLEHDCWRDAAERLLDRLGEPMNPVRVHETLDAWLPASHPLFLCLVGLTPRERVLFLDLETLGLGGSPVFLAATARCEASNPRVTQYLARGLDEEVGLLEQVDRELVGAELVITYNGKAFDWTVLRERFAYYGMAFPHDPIHIDLLHHARSAYRDTLPDLRLGTVEHRILGLRREDDLPSAAVPEFFTAYLNTGNPGPLLPILAHSYQDVLSLILLLDRLLRRRDDAG